MTARSKQEYLSLITYLKIEKTKRNKYNDQKE